MLLELLVLTDCILKLTKNLFILLFIPDEGDILLQLGDVGVFDDSLHVVILVSGSMKLSFRIR